MYRYGIKTLTQGSRSPVVSQLVTRTFQSSSGLPPGSPSKKGLHTTKTNAPGASSTAVAAEPFLNGHSSTYQEAMYESWQEDPNSVHKSWQTFFSNLENDVVPGQAYARPPDTKSMYPVAKKAEGAVAKHIPLDRMVIEDHLAVQTIIRAYQLRAHHIAQLDPLDIAVLPKGQFPSLDPKFYNFEYLKVSRMCPKDGCFGPYPDHSRRAFDLEECRGHEVASTDPLGIMQSEHPMPEEMTIDKFTSLDDLAHGLDDHHASRVLQSSGLDENDMERTFTLPRTTCIGGDIDALPLKDIVKRLEEVYCNKMGIEYMHIVDRKQCDWIREKFERPWPSDQKFGFTRMDKRLILERLLRSHKFEEFLARKYPAEKRFGLEGCEVLIPCLKYIIDVCSSLGVKDFNMGMPHRGRLNVLANVARKELHEIFAQFDSTVKPDDEGSCDVKYHLGASITRENKVNKKMVHLTICANPSHLEAVDPIVQGKTRAEQFYEGDRSGRQVMSILMHGDAAFSGQGVVYETFHLSDLPDYTTHGTIHIVVNNQIGFTTDPRHSRSSMYCTDVARVVNAPIFHVNADDPEAVMYVAKVASEWRCKFHKDVVIDLVCYRRNGHNEMDMPMFTQPLMYQKIASHKPILDAYASEKMQEGVIDESDFQEEQTSYHTILEEAYAKAKTVTSFKSSDWLDSPWPDFFEGVKPVQMQYPSTGVEETTLKLIGEKFSTPPEDYKIHGGLMRVLKERKERVKKREADWALGEAFAFGSLLKEGIHVRLSGQDVERGTFSHRHHVLHDQKVDKKTFRPLNNIFGSEGTYTVTNSSLSEYAVLGFELGFSQQSPFALCLWEAQFGDFANTAQCIIDNFMAAGETKWHRQTGLVMLLPHGYEGMGPEHSSARPERFLQMCNDDPDVLPDYSRQEFVIDQLESCNWQIVNCTTPANLFHVLRRQIKLPFRKPLIIFTPKSLLRLPEARSSFDEFTEGTFFHRMYHETEDGPAHKNADNVKKLIFCSGKVYYELVKEREMRELDDEIAIARVEQLFPFPYDLVISEAKRYPNANIVWAQEEHKNQGSYSFVQPRFQTATSRPCGYAGRKVSSSTATGNKNIHMKELEGLMNQAMEL